MSKNIFLFSGQGSQYVGMAKELCEKYDAANAVFDTAEKVLGYDLRAVTFDGPDTELNKTVNSQPAIMACSLAAFEAAKAEGITFDGVAGHSLGEYAAMVAAGVVTMEDGFKLIKARAAAMQKAAEANSGSMYAIIGRGREDMRRDRRLCCSCKLQLSCSDSYRWRHRGLRGGCGKIYGDEEKGYKAQRRFRFPLEAHAECG